jgi:membrane protein YdbS with pleckstrin-like domain
MDADLCQDYAYCVLYSWVRDVEKAQFVVSGTFKAPLDERSPHTRKPLHQRILNPLIAMHTIYWLLTVLLLIRSVHNQVFGIDNTAAPWTTGAVVALVQVVFAAFVPVRYMIWPPTVDSAHGKYWARRDAPVLAWQDVAEVFVIVALDWW